MSGLKFFKPVTSGQRGLILVDRSDIWRGKPLKSLTFGVAKTGGRNFQGRLTARGIGGGSRKVLRVVDLSRSAMFDIPAVVKRIEYDPHRTSYIALIEYDADKVPSSSSRMAYILAPLGLKEGDIVVSTASCEVPIVNGNCMPVSKIPTGVKVHNVELKAGKGGQLARAAGAFVTISGRDGDLVIIKLPSGELKKIRPNCLATIGVLSNIDKKNTYLSKAGRNRWRGIVPKVRGVAMNPVDHALGGGEGRTSGGRHPCSRNGRNVKGKKTRSVKKPKLYSR